MTLWAGQFWKPNVTITTDRGSVSESTVVEIICVDHQSDTVVIRCWKPTARTARTDWLGHMETMEIP